MTVQFRPTMEREQIYELINVDLDARRYFFHRADERWLDWLWRNGFLDAIKDENANPLAARKPELEYLLRMAEKRPDIVVDIMLATPITTDTRSQEVAYGFIRVCGSLPADQLARMVVKIRDERWIPLIDAIYRHSAFDSKEMLKTLAEANDFKSLLALAEAVLAVRPSEELTDGRLVKDNPFYLEYLARAGIFEPLGVSAGRSMQKARWRSRFGYYLTCWLSPINLGYLKWISSPCNLVRPIRGRSKCVNWRQWSKRWRSA